MGRNSLVLMTVRGTRRDQRRALYNWLFRFNNQQQTIREVFTDVKSILKTYLLKSQRIFWWNVYEYPMRKEQYLVAFELNLTVACRVNSMHNARITRHALDVLAKVVAIFSRQLWRWDLVLVKTTKQRAARAYNYYYNLCSKDALVYVLLNHKRDIEKFIRKTMNPQIHVSQYSLWH